MFNKKNNELNIEEIIERNRKDIELLEEKYSRLQEETQELYNKLGLSAEELKSYLANPSNFSSKSWKFLQMQKEKQNQEYERDVAIIKDSVTKEQRFKARNIPNNWIFVR